MGLFGRPVCHWIAFLLPALVLGACSRVPSAALASPPSTSIAPREALWTNTFPPIENNGAALRFLHYGLEEGLSQSSAQAILQDNQGFLWIGTQDGLNRFDGYSFTVYRPDPRDPQALSSGEILSIAGGSDGMLWIGTTAGLNRYDPVTGQFRHWTHDSQDPGSLSDDTVQVVYQDPQNVLWVGTQSGLDRFDPASGKFVHVTMPDKPATARNVDSINALYMDGQHILWIGTDDGLISYEPATDQFRRYRNQSKDANSLSFDQVSSIGQDADGALWVGTHLGLDRLDPSTQQFTRFNHSDQDPDSLSDDYVQTVYIDREGELWVGTRNGLDRFERPGQKFAHYRNDPADAASLSSNVVSSIYEDRGGDLWIGTFDSGLNEHDRSQDQFAYYHHSNVDPDSLSGDVIFPILPTRTGQIWIGTYDAGLNLFDPTTGQSEHFRHNPADPNSLMDDTVLSLLLDRSGTLWIGTHQGLDRLFPASTEFFHYVNDPADPTSIPFGSVYAVYEDSLSTYWVGTAQGLRILNPATGQFTKLKAAGADAAGLSDSPVMTIYQDRSGILWFGTDSHGLFRFNPTTGQLQQYMNDPQRQSSISSNSILDIYEDSHGLIWVGTFGGGLDRYLPGENAFRQYEKAQGLPNDIVYGILEDGEGAFWLSTNLGISRFDPRTSTFENFTAQDGLQSNEFDSFAFAKDSQGRLYFGGVKGMTVFDPAHIHQDPYVPPLAVTGLTTQDGKSLAHSPGAQVWQSVTLTYPQNSLDLSFAALSFSRPGANQYKYMLEGFDRDWHSVGSDHRGSYTNLPGGTYSLRIIGSNSDGLWNDVGTAVTVTVVPPFWQTWTFQGLAGILLIVGMVLAYRSRVRGIEAQKTALEHVVLDRTQALQMRNLDLEALYSADERMLRVLTQDEVLQALVDMAVDILEADKSAIFTQIADHRKFCVRVARGFAQDLLDSPIFINSQQDVLSRVAAGGIIILSNTAENPNAQRPEAKMAEMMTMQGFRSIMYMPINVQSGVLGVLGVYCATSMSTFNERRQRLFASLVQRAALSIENSRLFEQNKHLAILEERSRLAQDLHDSAKQKAFAALAQLGAAKKLADLDHSSAGEHLVEAENIVSEVIRDLTFFIQEFYPPNLKEKGLAAAVRDYAFAWEGRSGIRLDLAILGERKVALQVEQVMYRIVQEGLANIARHSHATQAHVRMVYGEHGIELDIRDNGIGFDPQTSRHGLGLQLIHERAESLGGRVDLETRPGGGTNLSIRIPMEEWQAS